MGTKKVTQLKEVTDIIYYCDNCGKEECFKIISYEMRDYQQMYDLGNLHLCSECYGLYKNKKIIVGFIKK